MTEAGDAVLIQGDFCKLLRAK